MQALVPEPGMQSVQVTAFFSDEAHDVLWECVAARAQIPSDPEQGQLGLRGMKQVVCLPDALLRQLARYLGQESAHCLYMGLHRIIAMRHHRCLTRCVRPTHE
jgi:hypothetical protein